jgi:hypothetical protein
VNIFVLSEDPKEAAQMHCDKHVPKMVVESAQMLSTAHRLLDGEEYVAPSKSGKRMVKHYRLPKHDDLIYNAAHAKHPCTIWTMQSHNNYLWHYHLWRYLAEEFEYRFKKVHASWEKLKDVLYDTPQNLVYGDMTPFAVAMPDRCKITNDPVKCYRYYYIAEKFNFAKWERGRDCPDWMEGWNTKDTNTNHG